MRVFALAFLAAKLWGKPVISLNQSFVVNHAADLAVAVNVFNAFSLNSFREKKSWAVANENGLHSSVLCPDFAFLDATEKAGKGPAGLEGGYFCVTGSAALENYALNDYAKTIEVLSKKTGLQPLCLYSRKSDRKLVEAICEKLGTGNLTVISQKDYKSHAEILPVLAHAAFTIGGRYHTSISALSMKTPVVLSAGNSHKNEGLGDMLGMSLPVFRSDDVDGILQQVMSYLENEAKVTEMLETGLQDIETHQKEFALQLSRMLFKTLAGNQEEPDERNLLQAPFPVVRSQISKGSRHSNIRSQIDINANLARYEWNELSNR